jgi:hypothetical protein
MKKLRFIFSIVLFGILQFATAQTAKNEKPVEDVIDSTTNCMLRYYYFPNLEAYYDSQKDIYMYSEKGEWKTAKEIPSGYRGYSIYNKINVVIRDYDDDDVIQFLKIHKKKYPYTKNLRGMTASLH